jgi:ferredoxin-NADP reductase
MAQTGYHLGKIIARRVVSPTVVLLDLVVPSALQFQAGQWLDFMVPPHAWVGGFSLASLPSELPRVTLAIKKSDHPPSQWVHSSNECQKDCIVQVQVGGTCILDESNNNCNHNNKPVVFCAGGIGISPLLSMYRRWTQLQLTRKQQDVPCSSFFYSVSTEEELVFRDELVETTRQLAAIQEKQKHSLILTLTRQAEWTTSQRNLLESNHVQCRTERYLQEFLSNASATSVFYLCGPPAMLQEGVHLLKQRGIDHANIHFEQWW